MLQRKRTIKSADIIRDLRLGMTIPQLMEKYKISLKALRLVFQKIVERRSDDKGRAGYPEGPLS